MCLCLGYIFFGLIRHWRRSRVARTGPLSASEPPRANIVSGTCRLFPSNRYPANNPPLAHIDRGNCSQAENGLFSERDRPGCWCS